MGKAKGERPRGKVWEQEEKEEAFVRALEEVAGGKALSRVLREGKGYPSHSQFFYWIDESEHNKDRYIRACEARERLIFDEILEIADDQEGDVYIDIRTGEEKTNHNVIQRSNIRIAARQWSLGKMRPVKYGDRMYTESKVETTEVPVDLSKLTLEELKVYKKIHDKK